MAWYSPIPSHPGTPVAAKGTTTAASGRVGRFLRVALPVVLVLLLAAAIYPAAAITSSSGPLTDYLPTDARTDTVGTEPGGEVWQGSQLLVAALEGFNELAAPAQDQLGYGDDLSAPELAGQWLRVDLLAPGTEGSLQSLSFHVTAERVTLQAVQTPTTWATFSPGLPVLDHAGLDGRAVSWAGTATLARDGDKPVSRRGTATTSTAPAAGAQGCVDTTITLGYDDGTGGDRVSRWCADDRPGWAGDLVGGRGLLRTDAPAAPHPAPDLAARPARPTTTSGPARPAQFFRAVDSDYYELLKFGPRWLAMAGDVLVTARYNGRIEGWSPTPGDQTDEVHRYLRWRAEPGAPVSVLTTVGSVTVAADTSDRISAWADDGWRLWQVRTDDVVTSLLPLTGSVVATDAQGTLRLLDVVTGTQRWSRRVSPDAQVAAGGDHVAVMADDTLTVLDAATGAVRWSRGLSGASDVVITDGLVVTKIDSWLVARSATTGSVVWWRTVDPMARSVSATTELIIVAGAASTRAVGPDGQQRWSTVPAQFVRQQDDLTVLTYADRVELWDGTGRIGSWSYPVGSGSPDANVVITDRGVTLYQPDREGSRWWDYR